MVRAATQRQVRRQIARMGRVIDMRLQEQLQDTSRGTGWSPLDTMPVVVSAIVDYGGDSLGYDLFGVTADASLVLYVRDDAADDYAEPIRDVDEASESGATEFDVDGDTFRVDTKNRYEAYGAYVLECEQV
jgi:hypothetical protein